MAKTIEQLKAQSAEVKNASVIGENTATRVGGLFNDIVEHVEAYEAGQAQKDTEQSKSINAETARATAAETTLSERINQEATERKAIDETIGVQLSTEIERAKEMELGISTKLNDEIKRATEAENNLQEQITSETEARDLAINSESQARTQNDQLLSQAIAAEQERAEAAEEANAQGIIYDVSANNDGTVFESLSALLSSSNLSALIPTSVRHGGMTIRFIQGSEQSSYNKYVHYFLTKNVWSASEANWQKLNLEKEVNQLDQSVKRNEYNIDKQCISKQLKNLYDKDSPFIVHGKYLNHLTGEEVVLEGYSISDYIPVEPNAIYTRGSKYNYQSQMCFYDENKAFISGDQGGNGYYFTFQTPSNCKYLRITIDDARTNYYLNVGDSIGYTQFQFILDNEKIVERIDKSKLDTSLVAGIETENLYNKDTLVVGYYVDGNGKLAPASGYNSTDYIAVEPDTIYTIFTGNNALENSAFYNQNKEKISIFNEYTAYYFKSITTPTDCYYIRCSVKDANKDKVMIYKGEEYRKSYPYGSLLRLSGIDTPNNIIFVSQDGRGDCTTITEALAMTCSNLQQGQKTENTIILINEGVYYEKLDIRYRAVELVGVNRDKCVIYYDDGNYGTGFPINMGAKNVLRNLTIKSVAPADMSQITTGEAYAVHFDITGQGTAILENCTLISELNSAFGVGLHANQTLICRNCTFEGIRDIPDSSVVNAGLLIHNQEGANRQNQKAVFDRCNFYSKKWVGITITDVSDDLTESNMEIEFIHCVCNSSNPAHQNKIDKVWRSQSSSGVMNESCIVGTIRKGIMSFGNNVSDLNYT